MFVQSDHGSTKPGVPSSNLGGRTSTGNEAGKTGAWAPTAAQIARFALNIDASAGPSACHSWQLSADRDGYGQFYLTPRQPIGAHRFALELKLGRRLLPHEVARHGKTCTTRRCCNQDHLTAGSQADNVRDREEAGRTARGERSGNSRLTAAQVIEARTRCASGETRAAVARSLGVGRKCVEHIVAGRNWKHLPEAPAVDYVAARMALGMTRAQAEACSARARRLGKRIASGGISLQRAAEIAGVADLMTVGGAQ